MTETIGIDELMAEMDKLRVKMPVKILTDEEFKAIHYARERIEGRRVAWPKLVEWLITQRPNEHPYSVSGLRKIYVVECQIRNIAPHLNTPH